MKVKLRDGTSRGFTLIEVSAVLIMIGILSTLLVSRIPLNSENDLRAEAEILTAHIRYVTLLALSNDQDQWSIAFTGGSYSLEKNSSSETVFLPGENDNTHTLSSGISITVDVETQTLRFEIGTGPTADYTITLKNENAVTRTITVHKETGYVE